MISVELVNLAVLNTNNTIMDILMNFLALVIISDFDDYFFQTVVSDNMAKLVSNGEVEIVDPPQKTDLITAMKSRFMRARVGSLRLLPVGLLNQQ